MTSIHDNQRFVIIHGHFYQPPRENPWLGFIERQRSAAPFRHWTERITEECYRSNAWSPLLARGGRIAGLHNNFERLSFNVGPTLLAWLEPNAPDVYRRVLEGDRFGAAHRGGHGNAIAQGYNHAILPLCRRRDKRTQVLWGLEDFRRRFGRRSEGIWLPETAVDLETVEVLIECGVGFVILAPSQLEATRPLDGSSGWDEIPHPGSTVHHRPYRLFGRDREAGHLDVFFFHSDLSREVSFDHLLRDGRTFSRRLGRAFDPQDPAPQVVVLATDGETFGHHEPFGNMCLTWMFNQPPQERGFRLTNFGQFLERFPPLREARLQPGPGGEGSAWSCAHGVGRWSRDCGCSTGAGENWNQQWRGPLRTALNRLRDRVDRVLEREGPLLGLEPREIRECLPRGETPFADAVDPSRCLTLRELHYYGQLMFTSCGWFFNDISGLEPVQNLFYARRVAELLHGSFGEEAEEELLQTLGLAVSNITGKGTGARIYRREVLPHTPGAAELVAAAALLRCCGVEQPLEAHGELRLETAALERIHRGPLTLQAGWSRLSSRLAPRPRGYLHLALRTGCGGFRSWAEGVEEEEAQGALGKLLASLDRRSEDEILGDEKWLFHQQRLLPPAFREMLEDRLRQRQDEQTASRMLELYGSGRELFVRATEEPDAGLALARLYEARVKEALEHGGPGAHRPATGMLRMARALGLRLDTTTGAAAAQQALAGALDRPGLFGSPEHLNHTRQLAGLAGRMGLDPAGNRMLQITFWGALERFVATGVQAPNAAAGTLCLADLLGFDRGSLKELLRKNARAELSSDPAPAV
jgi:hypothetical protein